MRKDTVPPGTDPSRSDADDARSNQGRGGSRDAQAPASAGNSPDPADRHAGGSKADQPAPSAKPPSAKPPSGKQPPGKQPPADEHELAAGESNPNTLIWPPPEGALAGWEVVQLETTGQTLIEPIPQVAEQGGRSAAGAWPAPATRQVAPSRPEPTMKAVPPAPRFTPQPPAAPVFGNPGGGKPSGPMRPAAPPVLSNPDENLPETQVIEPLLGEVLMAPPRPIERDPTTEPSAARPPAPVSKPVSGRDQTQPRLVPPTSVPAAVVPRPRTPQPNPLPSPLPNPLEDTVDSAAQTRIIPIPSFARPRGTVPPPEPPRDLSAATTLDAYPDDATRIIRRPASLNAPGAAAASNPSPIEAAWAEAGSPALASHRPIAPEDDWLMRGRGPAQGVGAAAPASEAPARKTPAWRIALFVIAILAIAEVAYLLVRTLQPAAATAVLGTLVVESAPVGAEVYVDGRLEGRTPFRIELPPGAHTLEVRAGDLRRTRTVTLQAGALASHMLELNGTAASTAAATASIEVRSEPAGARVMVGGVDRGRTPVVVSGLTPGQHQVQVSGPFKAVTRQVAVAAGQSALIVVTPARPPAPRPAPVDDDREEPKTRAPATASAKTAATGRGWITIDSPLVLRIVSNGDFLGTSEDSRIALPAGSHVIGLENESVNFREVRSIDVVANRGVTVTVALPQGTLSINAQPWAEVFVDNQRVGETPVSQLLLPIGPHEVLFRHPQFGERRATVVVKVGTPGRTFADFTK